jgi:hypothetical protein
MMSAEPRKAVRETLLSSSDHAATGESYQRLAMKNSEARKNSGIDLISLDGWFGIEDERVTLTVRL